MPQLVNKRRSRWVVLVVSALVASMLTVTGVSPAVAAEQQADAQATWTACLGPAKASHGFDDVDMGSVHYDNINCLAYYGITAGKTANTFDPQSDVTRSQMALFLSRMAKAAGVDLGDAMDAGFSDLGSTGADRVAAINRLVSMGIMEGRTATTFDPEGIVTRVDMAQHLFEFTDLALDSVHRDILPLTRDGDTTGIELNVVNDDGHSVDDWFGDARRMTPAHIDEVIGAVYELGITTGTNGMVGENGTFEPNTPVTRAQMASFIMRTLGHTNLRPAGLTAQQTLNQTQVSVRDADFAPIAGANVEFITTNFADEVFDSRGECIDRYVSNIGNGFEVGWDACRIDAGERQTDDSGNHLFPTGTAGASTTVCRYTLKESGRSDPDTKYGAWVWTGEYGDTVGSDTELTVPEGANSQTSQRTPASAVLTGGTSYNLKMGRDTVTYTLQLLDKDGNPVGPEPEVNRRYKITTYVVDAGATVQDELSLAEVALITGTDRKTIETRMPDSSGRIVIGPISHPDPDPLGDDNYVAVVVDVEVLSVLPPPNVALANVAPALVKDKSTDNASFSVTGRPETFNGVSAAALFGDELPTATSYTVSTRSWGRHNSSGNRNEATFTLLDQYGNPHSRRSTDNATYEFVVSPSAVPVTDPVTDSAVTEAVGSDGKARVVYLTGPTIRTENFNPAGETSTGPSVVVNVKPPGSSSTAVSVAAPSTPPTLYWAEPGLSGTLNNQDVLVADPRARSMVVGTAADPEYYVFGTDDSFTVNAKELSFAQFMEVLTAANDPDTESLKIADATLSVTGHNVNRPRDRAEWTLTLSCSSGTS